jgi:hypothetical protein
MVDRGLPRVLLYLAHKAVSRLREDMFVSLLFMHEMLRRSQEVSLHAPSTFEPVKIGNLLCAAYDMHTRDGLLALRRFGSEVAAVRRFVVMVPDEERKRLIGFGVFLAEGARLAGKLNYHGADELSDEAHTRS